MIKLYKVPQRSDITVDVKVKGDKLTINSEVLDLSSVTETPENLTNEFVMGPVYRRDGDVHVQVLAPYKRGEEPSMMEEPPEPLPDLEALKSSYISALDQEHAAILRKLTGNATIEERDTWQAKALAAQAYSNDTADPYQKDMLETEASMAGEDVSDLITKVLTKNAAFQKMIGIASGHRRATTAAIQGASDLEQLQVVLEEAREKAEQLTAAFIAGAS